MAINEWKLWQKIGFKQRIEMFDVDSDIQAVQSYLEDSHLDVKELLKQFKMLEKLRKEAKLLVDEGTKTDNLLKQMELYDQLLLRFEYFSSDAGINSIRVKNIAHEYMQVAKDKKFYSMMSKMKKESRWFFDW